jgi:hypothetical protein
MRIHHPTRRRPMSRLLLLALALCTILPVSVTAQPAPWTQVSVGDDHACALDATGRAYCWGNNHSAQLGARTPVHCGIVGESGHRSCYPTASDTLPLPAAGGMRFVQVSAGRYVTCGLDAEGRALCWGQPLGPPSAYTDRCLDGPCGFAPVPLEPGRRFAMLDMRSRCAVERDGTALCWGADFRSADEHRAPWPGVAVARVTGDLEGPSYCAALANGRAICEGEAHRGLLGNGSRDSASLGTPVDHPGTFTQVAVLYQWACALDADGAAWCWGAAGHGDARPQETRAGFERCARYGTESWCNTRPAPVAGGLRFRSLTPMPRGSMPAVHEMVGLTAEGEAYAWDGFRQPRPWHPEQRWASVSAGDWGQCGVTTAGELFCWGRNPHEEVQGLVPHPAAR